MSEERTEKNIQNISTHRADVPLTEFGAQLLWIDSACALSTGSHDVWQSHDRKAMAAGHSRCKGHTALLARI